jgi:hypothetical protein
MLKATPRYQHPANAIIRPDRVTVQTAYFHEKWLPRLGAERAMLVLTLRRLVREAEAEQGHYNEGAPDAQWKTVPVYALHLTSRELGEHLGLTAKQAQRLLKSRSLGDDTPWRELDPQEERAYKKYEIAQIRALQHFIPRLRYDYQPNPDTGRPEKCGYVLDVVMDEPLTSEDRETLNAEIGAEGVPNAKIGVQPAQNWRSGALSAKIGAQPSGNLTVTEASASGAAGAAAAFASPAHSLEQVAVDLSQTTTQEAATPLTEPQPCSPPRGESAQQSTRTIDLNLPLPELRHRALRDLENVQKRSSRIAIVTQFAGRLLGLGRDAEGVLRSKPDRDAGDYARVGELCKDFGYKGVLIQIFAIAGRVPDDVQDPIAYLRTSLEHKRRRNQPVRQKSRPAATGPGHPLDQLTFADYREGSRATGGGA